MGLRKRAVAEVLLIVRKTRAGGERLASRGRAGMQRAEATEVEAMKRRSMRRRVGVVMGVMLALGGSRLIRGILYEVSATDPLTYVAATAVVLTAVVAATYVPARRAGAADPARVLRGA